MSYWDDLHKFKYGSASCEIHVEDGVGVVMRVYSKDRGQGHGKGLLRVISEWADKNGIDLRLHARAYGGPIQTMLDNNQLVKFYESAGFEVDPDHQVDLGTMMIRIKNTPYSEREN